MKINLTNLFNYYKFSLEIEKILSMQIKPSEMNLLQYINLSEIIYDEFNIARKKESFFNFKVPTECTKKILKEVQNIDEDADYSKFFNEMSFLEKTLNYCRLSKGKLDEFSKLETDPNFIYSSDVIYEYSVFFCLIKPNKRNKDYFIPLFILNFLSRDQENKIVPPDVIFEQIKKAMGKKYNTVIDAKSLCDPILLLNPAVIESYDYKALDFEFENIEELWNKIKLYINENELPINDKLQFKGEVYLCACPPGMTQGLIRIYDTVLKNVPNELIKKYFTVHSNKVSEISSSSININDIITTKHIVKSYSEHIGAFDNKPLADTQRVALSCFLNGNSKIIPVNGAPGTGKTSLLRGVFGQYLVTAAIEAYQEYIKTKIVNFKTPIVCSSTNNQALFNISEGISSGFSEQIKNNPTNILYKRWIECILNSSHVKDIDASNQYESEDVDDVEIDQEKVIRQIDLSQMLFVPAIKGRKTKYFELSKGEINTIINGVLEKPDYYIKCFNEYNPLHLNNKNSLYDQLIQSADYFYNKIKENNRVVANLEDGENSCVELSKFEVDILNKYVLLGFSVAEIQEHLLKVLHDKNTWISLIAKLNELELKLAEVKIAKDISINEINELFFFGVFPNWQ